MNLTQALLKIEQLELDKVFLRKHITDLEEQVNLAVEAINEARNDAQYWKEMVADVTAEFFDTKPEEENRKEWDETRIDIIGQNGNTGEHYPDYAQFWNPRDYLK